MTNTTISLLLGYSWTQDVAPEEVIAIRLAVGMQPDTVKRWRNCIKESLCVVGVRAEGGELVGIGFLAGNARHAVLCDIAVHPQHQRQGIGTAISRYLVDFADKQGIAYLYASLSSQNSPKKYLDMGFVSEAGNLFREKP